MMKEPLAISYAIATVGLELYVLWLHYSGTNTMSPCCCVHTNASAESASLDRALTIPKDDSAGRDNNHSFVP